MKTNNQSKKPPSSTVKIYISNISEDVWPFISMMATKVQKEEIDENADLSDRDTLSFADESDVIIILPRKANPDFQQYIISIFNNHNFYVFTPRKHSGKISHDIINDNQLFKKIISISKTYNKIDLLCYSNSPEFYNLFNKLKNYLPKITIPESPRESDSWLINYFGTKSGIHHLANTLNFLAPPAMITSKVSDTIKLSSDFYQDHHGVVIKTNKGHSGAGIVIFRPNELTNNSVKRLQAIKAELKEDYWHEFPIVIEKFIPSDSSIGGGFPNAEFKINKKGQVKLLYYCGMRVTLDGVFKGVEINHKSLPASVVNQIISIGTKIGKKLAKFGYRGYYDVDFVAGKDKKMYLTESNIRRTGGTHVYHTAKALFGDRFMNKTYVLSQNIYSLPKLKAMSFTNLIKTLQPILFNKKTKQGLIISSANLLSQNKFGYIIFASDKTKAIEIEKKMESLLS